MARHCVALLLSAAASMIAPLENGRQFVAAAEAPPPRVAPDYPRHAPRLVEQALRAGLAGNADERAALLKRAADADGDYAPARWQRGELKFDGQWRTPAQVARHVAADDRWKQYAALSSEAGATPADQQQLALWCMRHELENEERLHWSNVLSANPGHLQARQRLGLQEHQRRLVPREQIAAEKQRREQAERDLARFKPKFLAWCREATSPLKVKRESSLEKIRAIDDPAAIPALREAVRQTLDTTAGKRYGNEIVLAMTAAFSRMPQHAATLQLAGFALYSGIPEVRQAAAVALRSRQPTDYVPLLMHLLRAPKEVDVDFIAAPDGTVRMLETVYQKQPLHEVASVRNTSYETEGALGRDRAKTDVDVVLNRHLRRAASRASATRARIEAYNVAAAERNNRVQETLKIALDVNVATDDVTAWWSAWQSYNELEYDSPQLAYEEYYDENYTFYYEQTPPLAVALKSPEPPVRTMSCFAPGTIVWRQSGPTPIEQIRVGDMVLAQHPTTGELAYRPVRDATIRREAPVLRLKFADDEIVATCGHRFWVEGAGWQMAKDLQVAGSLHAVNGTLAIESIEPAGEMACHNLEVDQFHTFVVGKSQLLAHDRNCPQPTLAVTPGLADPQLKLGAMLLAVPSSAPAAE
jgi:hypothetical protein